MLKKLPLPIGRTDYKKICASNYYVDKTLLIKEILDEGMDIILFTRPRRFGKTLNMDMLRTFFEISNDDTNKYFLDKKIWLQGERYTCHQGKYPVIFLSLKDIKSLDWPTAFALLKKIIRAEYARHQEVETSTKIAKTDCDTYHRIIDNTADDADYMFSLHDLSKMLHEHYGKAPVIIIDEYDTPIQEGYINGYYKEAVNFIRNFFSAALKDNPHISMSIMTGILRIAKESIFSGLNNIRVYSVLSQQFSSYFGFTDAEVKAMAKYYEAEDKLAEIKEWYDGYKFGDTEIYNPWSVLNYFGENCQAMPYWVQTSGNTVIQEIFKGANSATYDNLKSLLKGDSITSAIETNIIYPKLKEPQTNILGFLLMTGYLKSLATSLNEYGAYVCELALPNKEIKSIYHKELLSLLNDNLGEGVVYNLQRALLTKDAASLKQALGSFLMETISYYDGLKENYYHGLLLGLTAIFEGGYHVLSNRESGEGRFDIQLTPKRADMPGVIIEIKAADRDGEADLQKLAQIARQQIETKGYATELEAHGVTIIHKFGIAFSGKKVEVVSN